jgi:hypothetical protein
LRPEAGEKRHSAQPSAGVGTAIETQYGIRYDQDIMVTGANGQSAIVRTGWLMDKGSNEVRMTTAFVKNKKD